MSDLSKFLTVKEVAQILRLNVLTIYDFIKGGHLVTVKFGRAYRVSTSELERFIEEHLTVKSVTKTTND